GLVYRVYREAVDLSVPRTVKTLYLFCEALDRAALQPGDLVFFDTDGPLAHVGIYAGEGRFIHAASEGQTRGVMESSLSEPSWTRAYAGAGRLIPPAEYLGLILTASLGPSLGGGPSMRGASASAGLSSRLLGLEIGLEARPEFDAKLGVLRLPAVLSIAPGKDLRFFAGPALTLGRPTQGSGSGAETYRAEGGLLATAGLVWTPLRFKLAGRDAGIYGQLVYNRYVDETGVAADPGAVLSAGFGISFRWGF
ncbi:MAG TPA: NlpC/P60 family protein, partial [Rectinemataceae bacterium]|nr:NlpC/P60 family protein [Rectinemataceae bacterium]